MRVLLSLLLVVPGLPFPLADASPACVAQSHEERQQAGYGVVVDQRVCTDRTSARHTEHARVTQGPPADNRSPVLLGVLYEHDRFGDRAGGHAIREHAQVRSGTLLVDAWYNSTRTSDGYTRCSLVVNATQPRGTLVVESPLAACVPHELLQP